ncbi:hypothetical protein [Qipengyuania sp.]|uniref:hypothetical protein n=1 Tax=Qipengyuania sp. TaxID=2004515 RepID=UPI003AF629D9
MAEISLDPEFEDELKHQAMRKVLVSVLAEVIEQSHDPEGTLFSIRERALTMKFANAESPDPDVAEYANRYLTGLVEHFFDSLKLSRD